MVRRALLALLCAALPAIPGTEPPDEKNPRSPDQPLRITFAPWYCSRCVEDKLVEAEPREIQLMGADASKLAAELKLKRGWLVIESPDFKILSTLDGAKTDEPDTPFAAADLVRLKQIFPDLKPGKSTYLTAHQRAHLYQIRLERLLCHFRALTGNDLPFLGMGARSEVYLFEDPKQYRAFIEKSLGREYNARELVQRKHFPGDENHFATATAAGVFTGGEPQLNSSLMHHVGHMLVEGHRRYATDRWGWLDEGMAFYYERRESPEHSLFCLQGADPPREYMAGSWPKKIRYLVSKGADPNLGSFCDKLRCQELSIDEHVVAWSYVEWLATKDAIRLGKLMDLSADAKRKLSGTDAIREVFGITPEQLRERWREYVLATY